MRKLLVDTNILILWVVGAFDRDLVASHRRTAQFAIEDYDLLIRFRAKFGSALTTAPILTEVSNLLGNTFHEEIAEALVVLCRQLVEVTKPKDEVFGIAGFERLGFADCTTLGAIDEDTTLLSDDVALYLQALTLGHDAVNFSHLRRFQ